MHVPACEPPGHHLRSLTKKPYGGILEQQKEWKSEESYMAVWGMGYGMRAYEVSWNNKKNKKVKKAVCLRVKND